MKAFSFLGLSFTLLLVLIAWVGESIRCESFKNVTEVFAHIDWRMILKGLPIIKSIGILFGYILFTYTILFIKKPSIRKGVFCFSFGCPFILSGFDLDYFGASLVSPLFAVLFPLNVLMGHVSSSFFIQGQLFIVALGWWNIMHALILIIYFFKSVKSNFINKNQFSETNLLLSTEPSSEW